MGTGMWLRGGLGQAAQERAEDIGSDRRLCVPCWSFSCPLVFSDLVGGISGVLLPSLQTGWRIQAGPPSSLTLSLSLRLCRGHPLFFFLQVCIDSLPLLRGQPAWGWQRNK